MKYFIFKEYINDFRALRLSFVYSSDDPDKELDILNELTIDFFDRNTPLVKTKFTSLLVTCMNQLKTAELRETYRYLAHYFPTAENMAKFRNFRNEVKNEIKRHKRCLL